MVYKDQAEERPVETFWVSALMKIDAIEKEINSKGAVKDFGIYNEDSESDSESEEDSNEDEYREEEAVSDVLNRAINITLEEGSLETTDSRLDTMDRDVDSSSTNFSIVSRVEAREETELSQYGLSVENEIPNDNVKFLPESSGSVTTGTTDSFVTSSEDDHAIAEDRPGSKRIVCMLF